MVAINVQASMAAALAMRYDIRDDKMAFLAQNKEF